MSKLIFTFKVETVSPVSIKLPDQDGHPTMIIKTNVDGTTVKTAYIPGTTIRGKLRHAYVLAAVAKNAAAGKMASMYQLYEDLIGQDAKSEAQSDKVDLAAVKERRQSNHIIDVWGCGLGVSARLKMGHLMPAGGIAIPTEKFQAVRREINSNAEIFEYMSDEAKEKFSQRHDVNSKRAEVKKQIELLGKEIRAARNAKNTALMEELEAKQVKLKQQQEVCEKEMGEMKNSTKGIFEISAMPAGTDLVGRATLDKPQPKDLEMLFECFDLLSRDPIIGGNSARGFGEIKGKIQITDDEGRCYGAVEFGGFAPAKVSMTDIGTAFMAMRFA